LVIDERKYLLNGGKCMAGVRSNLKEMMRAKDPNLSIRQLAKDIDYHFDSVRKMYKDEMVQYPRDLLWRLCKYFNASPGQFIVVSNEDEDRNK
jgi:DNA-binding Xre family transcriptional regulator